MKPWFQQHMEITIGNLQKMISDGRIHIRPVLASVDALVAKVDVSHEIVARGDAKFDGMPFHFDDVKHKLDFADRLVRFVREQGSQAACSSVHTLDAEEAFEALTKRLMIGRDAAVRTAIALGVSPEPLRIRFIRGIEGTRQAALDLATVLRAYAPKLGNAGAMKDLIMLCDAVEPAAAELVAARAAAGEPQATFQLAHRVLDAIMFDVIHVLRAVYSDDPSTMNHLKQRNSVSARRKPARVHATPAPTPATEPTPSSPTQPASESVQRSIALVTPAA